MGGGGRCFCFFCLLGVGFGVILGSAAINEGYLGVCARTEMFSSGGVVKCM